jgi:thiol peroxidase
MAKLSLDGMEVHTFGELPETGTIAPDFTLVKSDLREVSLKDLKGKKLVLNIFPSIETNVCARSVIEFNQIASRLKNVNIICISKDLPFAHHRFCSAEGIDNLITLSNFRDDGDFARKYGVLLEDGAFKGLNARAVIIIDEEGKVNYCQLVDEIGNEPDYEAVLSELSKSIH